MGKKSSTSSSTTQNDNWLMQGSNKDFFQNWLSGQMGQIGNEIPKYELEGLNQWQQSALDRLNAGSQIMGQLGQYGEGMGQLAGAGWGQMQAGLDKFGNLFGEGGALTQQGMLDSMKEFYDSDLVASQTGQLQDAVGEGLASAVQGINQGASASGGMGSSRAGIMEGVATEGAAKAIATGSAGIQNAARQDAYNQAMGLAGQQLAGAQAQMGFGNQLLGQGMQGVGGVLQGMQQIGNKDIMNQLYAGGILQQQGQQQKEIDRLNQMLAANPELYNMQNLLPMLSAMGGWSSTTNQTGTTTQGGGMGNVLGSIAGMGIGAMTGGMGNVVGGMLGNSIFGGKK
ncbi:MAG: hypothetical protein ACRCYZ_02055 [Alphaproteobacteria bacterium]